MTKKKWLLVVWGLLGAGVLAALILWLPGVVWAVLGWVMLGLLGLLVLLLALPLTIGLRLENGTLNVWVRVLFVRLRLLPAKQRPEKEKKPKREKPKKEKAEAEEPDDKKKKKKSFGEMWSLIKRLAAAGWMALRRFLRHLRIRDVQLVLPVYAGDAADTAVRCGQLQAAIGTLRGLLDGRLHIHYKKLQLIPDFADRYKKELFFACKIMFCPGIIFPMGFAFLRRFLRKRAYSKRVYKRALAEKRAARAQNRPNGQRPAA